MADLVIKPSSGNLVLKDDQDVARVTVATSTGVTTLANATITAWTPPAGTVLQIVQATTTTGADTTSTSDVTTGLSKAITPSATSSKILVTMGITYDTQAGDRAIKYSLYKGGSILVDKIGYAFCAGERVIGTWAASYLDSPSTTSSTTYELKYQSTGGSTVYGLYAGTFSSMTLTEIAG